MEDTRSWIGIDFDGTLAHYEGWSHELGQPVKRMVKFVKDLVADGQRVKIFTARVSSTTRDKTKDVEQQRAAIEAWCLKYIGKKLEVTCEKDYGMTDLYDDRAWRVQKNTGHVLVGWM